MKKISAVFGLLFCLIGYLCLSVFAEETGIEEEFRGELEQFRESLPPGFAEEAIPTPENFENIRKIWSFGTILKTCTAAIQEAWPSSLALLSETAGLLLFCAVFYGIRNAWGNSAVTPACEFCSVVCITLALANTAEDLLHVCDNYFHTLTELINGVTPAACAVAAASGKLSSAAAARAALMLLYALFQNCSSVVLWPVVRISLGFSIAGALSQAVRLESLGRCARRIFLWILSLFSTLLIFVIGMQNVIARSADSFASRFVKFAMSSFIPLVSGAMNEAISAAAGGLRLIGVSCGTVAAAAVFFLLLPVIVRLILQRTVFAVCQGAAEMLGCDREARLLGEMHGILGYMLALCAVASLLFLFVLILLTGMAGEGMQ